MKLKRWESWRDNCPLCHRRFNLRSTCPHTVTQAIDRLNTDWQHALLTSDFSNVQFIPPDFKP